jgi:pimeloyl-ACP methyl ester carboxylesterase
MTEPGVTGWSSNLSRVSVNGCQLRYLRLGSGTPVVLLHTLRTQLEYFARLIGRLDTGQFEAIALDLPGHGESTAPRVDYTADYFADAVEGFLEARDIRGVVLAGESIGATIALILAGRGNGRVERVVALNPYDYGRWGGIRRSSTLNNLVFTAMLWPGLGPAVPYAATKGMLRLVMAAGLHDSHKLSAELVDAMRRCGLLPGHPRAFRSLSKQWRSWISARDGYAAIGVPVTLVYGEADWSRPAEREANANVIPGARSVTLDKTSHFSSLERPQEIARLIVESRMA